MQDASRHRNMPSTDYNQIIFDYNLPFFVCCYKFASGNFHNWPIKNNCSSAGMVRLKKVDILTVLNKILEAISILHVFIFPHII